MNFKMSNFFLKIFRAVPQSTPTEGGCIITEEAAESASSMATSPGNLSDSSRDASTQCCVGARFVITRSGYTHTDPVVSTLVPQPVKTFADAGTQVDIIGESHDGSNPSPSGHSSHVKDEKETKCGGIDPRYCPAYCDKFDKKKQECEENINADKTKETYLP